MNENDCNCTCNIDKDKNNEYKPRPDLKVRNQVIDTMLSHHTVRSFTDKEMDEETLRSILVAAQSAPTWLNGNDWSVIVIKDKVRQKQVRELIGRNPFIDDAAVFLIWVADLTRHMNVAHEFGEESPAVQLLDSLLVPSFDAALAAQNALVVAESLGWGTCFIGSVRNNLKAISEFLNIPKYSFPVVGLAIGWPSPDATGQKPRLPLNAQAHRNSYDLDASLAGIEHLDEEMKKYDITQNEREIIGWKRRNKESWTKEPSFSLRGRNTSYYLEQGFGIN